MDDSACEACGAVLAPGSTLGLCLDPRECDRNVRITARKRRTMDLTVYLVTDDSDGRVYVYADIDHAEAHAEELGQEPDDVLSRDVLSRYEEE